jgi:hypothetical protein
MVNPGFYSDSHWRFKVQFGAVDMRRRVWNGKLYNADNEVVFEWQSTLPASGEGTIDLSDAVNGNLTLEATAEQHFQVEGARPYQWALYDISEPTDPFFMAAGRAFVGSPGSGRTIFEQGSTVTPIPAAILTQSSLLTYIQAKGLTSGLALCVDVGDSASLASGAAQAVTDLSGAGNHLWRGATSSAEASDPTFSGVANAKTAAEKLTVNGSQYLTSQATGALANAHKDSAKWSVVAVLKAIWDGATGWNLFGTGNSAQNGFRVAISNGGQITLTVRGGGSVVLTAQAPLKEAPTDRLMFLGLCVDEAGGDSASVFQIDDVVGSFNGAYSAPSALAADGTFTIFARPDHSNKAIAGAEFVALAAWDGVCLSGEQVEGLRRAMLGRWDMI